MSFNEALIDIVAERFDAGIRIGERIERDMIAVRVTDELPLVVAGSPAYFAQRGKPKSPKDLVAHDCIRTRFASGTYLPWRFRVKRRDLEVHVKGRLVVNSASVARRAAVEGLALIQDAALSSSHRILPRANLRPFSTNGRQLRRQDFFFIIRAAARCGQRSRPC